MTEIDAAWEELWLAFRAWEDAQPEGSEVEYLPLHERIELFCQE